MGAGQSARIIETDAKEPRTVDDTLSISNTTMCFKDWSNCPKSNNPSGYDISKNCAVPCQFTVPAGTSVSSIEISRVPNELIPQGREQFFPESANKKLYLRPSMPFKLTYNGSPIVVDRMTLYHPCPLRIENVQYDAVLQLNDPAMSDFVNEKNDTVILIPLAGSNRPDEAGNLISKIAPFITGLADTAVGDVEQTGGTTIAASNPEQQSRCKQVQKERDRRWGVTMEGALNRLKREVINIAHETGSSRVFTPEEEGGTGELERAADPGYTVNEATAGGAESMAIGGALMLASPIAGGIYMAATAIARAADSGYVDNVFEQLPAYLKTIILKRGVKAIWSDNAYVWEVMDLIPGSQMTWEGRYYDKDKPRVRAILNRIYAERDRLAEQGTASEQREEKEKEQEFLNMIESGIPNPNEPITPCEILNVGVGQDWALSTLIPVGAGNMVKSPYFTWTSSKVMAVDNRGNPQDGIAQFGTMTNGFFIRYIVMEKPIMISSADLRSIRSLPPVPPQRAGIRFVETKGILYRNAVPDNCVSCGAIEDASEVLKGLQKGKVDKDKLFKLVFSFLGALALVMGVYFGLKWAMGTKGETFKNLGVKVGSYVKGVRESRTTSLPKGAQAPAQIFPSEKSKVSDVIPGAIKAAPSNLPAEVYRAPEATKIVSRPRGSISGPRKRSTFTSIVP